MDFYIKQAILHLYDADQQALNISKQLLDLSQPVIHDYILKKLERAYSDKLKSGRLEANHELVELVKQEDFIQSSVEFCQKWLEAYKIAEKQAANDLICILYEQEGMAYFAFIRVKLNRGFANQTGLENNQIQVNPYQLPSDSQLPDEAFLLNLETDEFLLLEKQIKFNGANIKYFSENILKASTKPSVNDQLKQIKQTAKKIGKSFDTEEFQMASTIQKAVVASLDEVETFDPKKISESLFPENLTAQLEFQEATKASANLKMDEAIKHKTAQKLATQKLSLSYGIEITVPNDVYDDADRVEFIQNADGTYSILIKNITDIKNKFI
ncbi:MULTISPECIES: nucleoid-associated protein [unclassified Enterococcus]|uniref:nucleoid-associated protein n=1 Tax=unclassified Enterococcus TaxID=2608891 RepID=UPI001557B098|nr:MULTISPECIES: nucleoid-associated protein [unclassified Enterococcus]MBS7576247.1 nucleoid-associated protein [Enterococcus sp. MMGLQ5-2]MBS7583480.1 nucleoid-associated protein [Enterococcus sp. MMGLQ5-1]NPD11342.1 nucleoid-associated protein [Enterococcus sp. MMGLQ5-1]NPD36085.1 nucleoid-associated protein [Enterococcus sp. MMGLQ5-2]